MQHYRRFRPEIDISVLPGICRANRQLYFETTPAFLARDDYYSWNNETSKQTLPLFNHLSEDVFKGVTVFAIHHWCEEGTHVQLDLISKFTNLKSLKMIYGFPTNVDGKSTYRFDFTKKRLIGLGLA